jgi:3-oxoacyl-[acyl-carrier protein] reductase
MDLGIAGKLALVVGATGDTGREVALALAAEGCRLALVARGAARLYDVARASPTPAWAFPADLTDPAKLDQLLADLPREVGIPDILVHVMGGSGGIKDPMLPWADWERVARLNLGIAHDINRAFLPAMISKGWGRIVHFSTNGTTLHIGHAPYTSAKHQVEGYVKNMAKLVSAKGVVITAVRPGPIFTEGRWLYQQQGEQLERFMASYLPIGRWGRGYELANAVAFLCSQQSSYMAGAVVDVDGGMR